jgi:hypothetical protein
MMDTNDLCNLLDLPETSSGPEILAAIMKLKESSVGRGGAQSFFPYTHKLGTPIVTAGGTTITEVVFRTPKGRDRKRWCHKPDTPERTIGLLCDLTGLSEDVFDEMSFEDDVVAAHVARRFFTNYRPEEDPMISKVMTSPSFAGGLREMWTG